MTPCPSIALKVQQSRVPRQLAHNVTGRACVSEGGVDVRLPHRTALREFSCPAIGGHGLRYFRLRYDCGVQQLRRITSDPALMGGKPCIRGMRVTVGMVIEAIAAGRTIPELLSDFPYLEEQDMREALSYAANLAQRREIPLAS